MATSPPRRRVPAAERRDALIDAAIHAFAEGGLHGTPVDRIARAVGVAQPYVFSLFGSKRELFLAAVDRCFARTAQLMTDAAEAYDPQTAPPEDEDVLRAMGNAYARMLGEDRDALMLSLNHARFEPWPSCSHFGGAGMGTGRHRLDPPDDHLELAWLQSPDIALATSPCSLQASQLFMLRAEACLTVIADAACPCCNWYSSSQTFAGPRAEHHSQRQPQPGSRGRANLPATTDHL